MYTFLLVLLVLVSFVLIAAILLQSGTGQGLSASFGGASSSPDSFIGMRQAGNLLTKISWWGGGIFLALAFILQLMSSQQHAPHSVLEGKLGAPAPLTAPSPSAAAPAIPLTPAPATPTPTTPLKK
ncbi:MAG: preprotein translocase subunit SecG [Gemmatimonadota bacterium]|nr:preprotein translocase subunit SecG [Gemmatimonadota bacterium]